MIAEEHKFRSVHVLCGSRGTWLVRPDGREDAISEHPSESEAEIAAGLLASLHPGARVLVHDRYNRVHEAAMRTTGR